MKKRYVVIPACILGLCAGWLAFCGYAWSWGPFGKLHDLKTAKLSGNASQYGPESVKPLEHSPIRGKHIVFLGSSVTYGAASKGVSFADYIAIRNNCTITKEAVSGTTLADSGARSYISRLKDLDRNMKVDLFVCQLSTNDATQKKPLGAVSENEDYDTSTVAGAIEYIIDYAKTAWGCPVVFYTNPQYDSSEYAAMVDLLGKISKKWNISVIDLWSDEAFNIITEEKRQLYMADPIHPTQAGYLEWWTPVMEDALYEEIRR